MTVPEPFAAVDVIIAKRDKHVLSNEQIDWVVDAYTRGVVADEQMSALAMAILLNGMTSDETIRFTQAMLHTGIRLNWDVLGRPTADKHSTGGVGDKITLPLAPVVAACGVSVPQLGGRGLGHTGGTMDKMESLTGWSGDLTPEQMLAVLQDAGAVIAAAGPNLAPADKKLYALRDVTGTVEAIPLIAGSIMSKKLAEGTGALVLDVKVGSGAFMKTVERARELAQTLVAIGVSNGVATSALLTAMDVPLGRTAGNALEVQESIDVLAGGGPSDVIDLTVALAREMLSAAGVHGKDPADALRDGSAMDVWRRMVKAQGGDPDTVFPVAPIQVDVVAPSDGFLTHLDAYGVGVAAWRLGAGRMRKEDAIDLAAGIVWHVVPGDAVRAGQPIMTLHTSNEGLLPLAHEALDGAWGVGPRDAVRERLPLVIERVTA